MRRVLTVGTRPTPRRSTSATPPEQDPRSHPPMEVLDTPNTPTIATLVEHLRGIGRDVDADGTLKNVAFTLRHPDGIHRATGRRRARRPRGRHEAARGEPRARQVVPAELDEDGDLAKGYIGPQSLPAGRPLRRRPSRRARQRVGDGRQREGPPRRQRRQRPRLRAVGHGSGGRGPRRRSRAGGVATALEILRGIEIGHIFQLGRKYADVFELDVLNVDGKPTRVTMGSYGIGVTRAVAAIAEQTHDDARPALAARRRARRRPRRRRRQGRAA